MKPGSDAEGLLRAGTPRDFADAKLVFFTCALFAHGLACGKDWSTCGAVPKRSGGMSRG